MNPILYYIFIAACVLGVFTLVGWGGSTYGARSLMRSAGYRPDED